MKNARYGKKQFQNEIKNPSILIGSSLMQV